MRKSFFFIAAISFCFALSGQIAPIPHIYGHIFKTNSGAGPIFYLGDDTNAPFKVLQVINSSNSATASGLNIGGLQVADNYSFAWPKPNDAAIKGHLSVGLPSTTAQFHVKNTSGSYTPGNYAIIEGNVADNLNYPGLEFRGGAIASAFPHITLSNGGLSLVMAGGYNPTYNQQLSFGCNSNSAGASNFSWYRAGETLMYLDGDQGKLGIGVTSFDDSKLMVAGKITSEEINVQVLNAPDYVFAADYKLPTLTEIRDHITEKGHLPEVPSAEEMHDEGVELGKMNMLLLKKIEELTLYLMAQDDRLEKLEIENMLLLEKLAKLDAQN